ncbi:DUF975 family protein [Jeotgalibaca ciconiae]|uniref:DUF975 family protein n=1 Tax=Jeotgalibaca ciconiae TaxID=2496265 RepID=A0A3Q9BKR8_9LACT|nr:DUF975 family protein [Jeotgalibaca ciconiae]AZP03537.1 DUF975 family protein [Jeotgalibaca ciconiae]
MSVKNIREEALLKLKGNWLLAMVGYVMTFFIPTILSQILLSVSNQNNAILFNSLFFNGGTIDYVSLISENFLLLLFLMIIFFSFGILRTSYRWLALDIINNKDFSIKSIFQVLDNKVFWKTCQLILMRTTLIMLWSMLFIIPGIIKGYEYSQAINVLKENPEMKIIETLKISVQKMKGYKRVFLVLQLSYILWYFIPTILYVLFIWANWSNVQVGFDMGADGISIVFGLALGILTMFGSVMFLCSFYVEPFKATAKQVFYKAIMNEEFLLKINDNRDSYEQKLVKK